MVIHMGTPPEIKRPAAPAALGARVHPFGTEVAQLRARVAEQQVLLGRAAQALIRSARVREQAQKVVVVAQKLAAENKALKAKLAGLAQAAGDLRGAPDQRPAPQPRSAPQEATPASEAVVDLTPDMEVAQGPSYAGAADAAWFGDHLAEDPLTGGSLGDLDSDLGLVDD